MWTSDCMAGDIGTPNLCAVQGPSVHSEELHEDWKQRTQGHRDLWLNHIEVMGRAG